MSKGKRAVVGDENVSANGYTYVKTSTGWILKHWLVAEEKLGRPITKSDRVSFKDRDRTNFDPDNIIITEKGSPRNSGMSKRLTTIEERMISYVEDHEDKSVALNDLKDTVSDVRTVFGFSVL